MAFALGLFWFLVAVAAAYAIGKGTYMGWKKNTTTAEAQLAKKRLLSSGASLILLMFSGITPLIAGAQLTFGDKGASFGVAILLILINFLPKMLGYVGCLYSVSTYISGRRFVAGAGCVILIIGLLLSALLMLALGLFMLYVVIIATFVIWLLNFLYLKKLNPDDSDDSDDSDNSDDPDKRDKLKSTKKKKRSTIPPPPPPSDTHTWKHRETRTVYEISLWGNKGKQAWLPAQSPVRVGKSLLSRLCSDGAPAPDLAYMLKTTPTGDGRVWTLHPAPDANIRVNGEAISAPSTVKPGDKISLLSSTTESYAKVMVKIRGLVEREP